METLLKEFKLPDGESVWVETVSQPQAGRINIAEKSPMVESFEKAWENVKPAITLLSDQVKKLSPDGVELKFGITLKAEVGAIFTRGSTDANFQITLKWDNSK